MLLRRSLFALTCLLLCTPLGATHAFLPAFVREVWENVVEEQKLDVEKSPTFVQHAITGSLYQCEALMHSKAFQRASPQEQEEMQEQAFR